ncbi:MAG: FAD:protein FMN transferase [Armatimonadota bacterium]|nr:FAD:protein FMN transferase [Armatimonadota bacterium]
MTSFSSVITLSRNAMATRFEIVLCGEDESRLRAAGEEALDEVERLDARLSAFRPDSEISDINVRAARESVRIDPSLFRLLRKTQRLNELTEGAFDITVGPLMQCWGLVQGKGRKPEAGELEAARRLTGMRHVVLDEASSSVRFDLEGVSLDLGAIGKGHAVQRAADILRDVGVSSALIHGGTSSVYGIGAPPDGPDWRVAIRHPAEPEKILAVAGLRDSSLSVSAAHGKSFTIHGIEYGHVIDPRTGYPSQNAVLAAVVGPNATEGDALSTALLVLGETWLPRLIEEDRGMKGLVAARADGGVESRMIGFQ